jgi:hypothetical protein
VGAHQSWQEEQQSVWLYRIVAQSEPDPARNRMFHALADAAAAQAENWRRVIEESGGTPPGPFVPARARMVAALVRRFGPRAMRPVLAAMKVRGMGVYDVSAAPGHAMPASLSDVGRRHKGSGAGATCGPPSSASTTGSCPTPA